VLDTPAHTNGHSNGHSNGHANDSVKAPGPSEDLQGLLDRIVECASQPLGRARAFPSAVYKSEELYDLEVEKVWRKSWLYACRLEEIENPGDWVNFDVAGEPIMVTRGRDNEVRALSRVCPHRFMDVNGLNPEDRGHSDSFVCPYHNWAFGLDGQMVGAPLMQESELFQEQKHSYCLREFRAEIWRGFVFINLDAEAAPLMDTFGGIDKLLGNYKPEDWRKVSRMSWGDSEVNWKLALDNGREGYHHQGLHKDSIEALWPAHMVKMEPTETYNYFVGRMFVSEEAAIGQEDGHFINPTLIDTAPGLTPYERSHYLVIGVYPGFILIPGPDMTLVQTWTPTGPTSHDMNFDILFHESVMDHADFEMARDEAHRWIHEIQGEDSAGLVALQKTVTNTRLDLDGGALSHLERPMWSIQRFLANRLTGAEI
jgi:phenylpropionate dioxygenase-like ring-hydroxylating dioxygenase large terminal subunit